MRVALTGSTGFVGRALIHDLLAAGHEVVAVLRRPRPHNPSRAADMPRLSSAVADYQDATALSDAFRGADAVIHLVGIISEFGSQTFSAVHTGVTRVCLGAAISAGVSRWTHMSALGTRPQARSRYHQTKWEAEEAVRSTPLAWTIFRPSLIYGPDDQFTRLFARMAAMSPVIPVLGPGTNLFQPIGVGAVARAFGRALGEPAAHGHTYDLCGPDRVSLETVIREILAARRCRRILVHVPWPVARFQAFLLEMLVGRLLHRPPPLNRDQLRMLQEDNVGDGKPADQLFGLEHLPFRQGIAQYLSRP